MMVTFAIAVLMMLVATVVEVVVVINDCGVCGIRLALLQAHHELSPCVVA